MGILLLNYKTSVPLFNSNLKGNIGSLIKQRATLKPGIRNPESGIWNPESGIRNLVCRIWNTQRSSSNLHSLIACKKIRGQGKKTLKLTWLTWFFKIFFSNRRKTNSRSTPFPHWYCYKSPLHILAGLHIKIIYRNVVHLFPSASLLWTDWTTCC